MKHSIAVSLTLFFTGAAFAGSALLHPCLASDLSLTPNSPSSASALSRRHAEVTFSDDAAVGVEFDLTNLLPMSMEGRTAIPGCPNSDSSLTSSRFQTFSIPDEGFTYERGKPILPAVSRFVVVPPTAGLRLEVDAGAAGILRATAPPPLCDDEELARVDGSSSAALLPGLYPPAVAEMSAPFVVRGVRMVRLTTYPIQYDPASGSFLYHDHIKAEIRFTGDEPIAPAHYPVRRHRSRTFLKMIRGLAINGDEVGRDDPDYDVDPPYVGHYLVVCHANLLRYAGPFIEWRRKAGYKVDILSVPANNARDYNWIKARIQERYNAYLQAGVDPFDEILMIGDDGYSGDENALSGNPFDWDYACLEGGNNDEHADVGIGRWIAGNESLMALFSGRTLGYEMTPRFDNREWFTRGAVFSQRWAGNWHISLHTNVRWGVGVLKRHSINDVRFWENFEQPDDAGVSNFMAQQITDGVNLLIGRAQAASFQVMNARPNGVFPVYINYAGHQEYITWRTMRSWNGQNLLGPVVATNIYGTPATISNNILWLETVNAFVQRDLPIGWALVQAAMAPELYIPNYAGGWGSEARNYSAVYGDPGLQAWFGVPREVRAEATAEITPQTRRVDVRVETPGDEPVAGAQVTLYFPGNMPAFNHADYAGYDQMQTSTRQTDADGNAAFVFEDGARFVAGTRMFYTVTGRDIKPLLNDRAIGTPESALDVSSYELTDGEGNEVGEVNPGESYTLFLTARNLGDEHRLEAVTATVTAASPYVEVEGEELSFGDIGPGEESESQQGVRLLISPSCPDGASRPAQRPTVEVELQSGGDVWHSAIHLEPRAPHFEALRVVGGNVVPDSAFYLDVEIKNVGSRPSPPVTALVRSLGMGVSVVESESSYPQLAPGRSARLNGGRFFLSGNSVVVPGWINPMQIVLTSESGFIDTVTFNLQVMTPRARSPQGPDAYGYICFDDTDVTWDLAPEYDFVEIDPRAQDVEFEGEQAPFEGRSPSDIGEAKLVQLPFQTQFYGLVYDRITIGSNGFIAMGDQRAITNFQNWPLDRGIGGGAGMIAPLWDKLTLGQNGRIYTYHNDTTASFIIEWSRLRAAGGGQTDLTFQVILYDREVWITQTGDQNILMQYKSFEAVAGNDGWSYDVPYASVGISSPRGDAGISYCFNNQYPATSARLENRRAILFTTYPKYLAGVLYGYVSDHYSGEPVAGAHIYTGHGFVAVSDSAGYWRIGDALAEVPFWIKCSKQGFNDSAYYDLQVAEDDSLVIDFDLLHPEFILSTEFLSAALEADQEVILPFTLTNAGNGPLNWRGEKRLIGDANAEPWELRHAYPTGQVLNDDRLEGVVFAHDQFFVCGANGADTNLVYMLDRDGALLDTMLQLGTSRYGYKDLEWDGELIWGAGADTLYGFAPDGNLVYNWSGPLNPTGYIAWDSDRNLLWLSGTTTDIYPCDIEGRVLDQPLNRKSLRIYGLAYWPEDPDGYTLYILNQPANSPPLVHKMNPVTGDTLRVFTLPLRGATSFNAAWITNQFDVYSWVLMTIANAPPDSGSDRLEIYQLEARKDWMELDSYSGALQTDEVHDFTLTLNSTGLPDTLFRGEVLFRHNADDGVARVAVELNVFGPLPPEPFGLVQPAQDDTLTALPLSGDTLRLPGVTFRWERARDPNRADAVRYQFHIGVADSSVRWVLDDTTLTLNPDTLRLPFWFDRPIVWWVNALSGPDQVPCREPFRLHIIPNEVDRERLGPPVEFGLGPIYPNPFNSQTSIYFALDRAGPASLKLFDITGRLVDVLHGGESAVGVHRLALDGGALPSGVYWVRLESLGRTKVQKMALVR